MLDMMRYIILCCLVCFTAYAFPKEAHVPGGIVKLYFNERPKLFMAGLEKPFFTLKRKDKWLVLLPLSLYSQSQQLRFTSQTSTLFQVHVVDVEEAPYPTQHIHVKNREYIRASKNTLARIKVEQQRKIQMLQVHSRCYLNDVKMIKPLESPLRHDFGTQRYFNGVAKSPHAGIDLSGNVGDKIKAPLAGEIMTPGDFFYNGKLLMIDHGGGLITAYSHLSKIYHEEGDWVKQGEYIGEVGKTGRVTGPHLHWSVYLNGEPVNPDLFLEDARF